MAATPTTTCGKRNEDRMMVIHHSKFAPHRSYHISTSLTCSSSHDQQHVHHPPGGSYMNHSRKQPCVRLYNSFGYTSEYHAMEPLLSNDSISTTEFDHFLSDMEDDDDMDGHHQHHNNRRIIKFKTDTPFLTSMSTTASTATSTIIYNGIKHDPALQTDPEVKAMRKHHKVVQRYGLTVPLFRHSLRKQPKILHLTFHGEYDRNSGKASIKFDSTPALPLLLTSSQTFLFKGRTKKLYRDYIAAIARLWEEEIWKFVHGNVNAASNGMNGNQQQLFHQFTWLNAQSPDDMYNKPRMRQLLMNIARDRFQCQAVHYPNKKCVMIWWGRWTVEGLQHAPNRLMLDEYLLSNLCTNRQIDAIVRSIKSKYRQISKRNQSLVRNLNPHFQLYEWAIMNLAIHQVIPHEVWSWLDRLDEQQDEEDEMEEKENEDKSDDDGKQHVSSPRVDGDEEVMNGELYNAFQRTFELTVSPDISQNQLEHASVGGLMAKRRPTEAEESIMEQRIRAIMEKILREIRQDIVISPGREYESPWLPPPLLNFKILRFKNNSAIYNARIKVIGKFQRDYKNQYIISFKPLSEATLQSQALCGYVPFNVQKEYTLNEKKNDDIPSIIQQELVSKEQCKIKLLLLLGCYSYHLAAYFMPYIECIICVHPHTQIDDNTCVKFSEYFYKYLASTHHENKNGRSSKHRHKVKDKNGKKPALKYRVLEAYQDTIAKLKRVCFNDNECKLHGHIHIHDEHDMQHDIDLHHPNKEFLQQSANRKNMTREEHLAELNKYKDNLREYDYQHPLHEHYQTPSLMIQRIGPNSAEKLKQYVFSKLQSMQPAPPPFSEHGNKTTTTISTNTSFAASPWPQTKFGGNASHSHSFYMQKAPTTSPQKPSSAGNDKSMALNGTMNRKSVSISRTSAANQSHTGTSRGAGYDEYSHERSNTHTTHNTEILTTMSGNDAVQLMDTLSVNNIMYHDNYPTHSLPAMPSIGLQQSLSPASSVGLSDHEEDHAADEELHAEQIISWQWYQSKIRNFDYVIIQCSSEEAQKAVKSILETKIGKEKEIINNVLERQETIGGLLKKQSTMLDATDLDHEFDDEVKMDFTNLRWDITDLPICCCSVDAPHRVEDKLILLMDGKQIHSRGLKLPLMKTKSDDENNMPSKPSRSAPAFSSKRQTVWPCMEELEKEPSPPEILDFPTEKLVQDYEEYDGDHSGSDSDGDGFFMNGVQDVNADEDGDVILDQI